MPLTVDFQKRFGYFTQDGEQVWMCHANCLMAMIGFHKDEETGEEMAILEGMFGDIQHVKNLFADSNYFDGLSDFVFYAKEMNDQIWELARLLAEHGIKVTIE